MKGLFVATFQTFIKPIIAQLGSACESVRLVSTFDAKKEFPVDFIWVDFCTEEALKVQEFATNAKKILRIHSYELYTELIQRIKPAEWHAIIFVSERCKNLFVGIHGQSNNLHVIYNYTEADVYNIPTSNEMQPKTKNVAYAGYLTRRKGMAELYELARMMPDHRFFIAGLAQEPDFYEYLLATKPDNVEFHGWQESLADWYRNNDISYFFLGSHRESFCCSMFEAMLCGVIPVTRNWLGAEEFYPAQCIWDSLEKAKSIITDCTMTPESIKAHAQRFDTSNGVIGKILTLLYEDKKPMVLPSLTVAIVQTRKKYLPQLINSIALQDYPCSVMIYDNMDRDKSIGKCFNDIADRCQTDFILYVGDDDILSEDYIPNAMYAFARRWNMFPETVGVLTGATMFNDEGRREYTGSYPTGFWRPEFIRNHRFDESLVRQVDTEFISRANKVKDVTIMRLPWIVGYYYRQHENNISGNKFIATNTSQEPERS